MANIQVPLYFNMMQEKKRIYVTILTLLYQKTKIFESIQTIFPLLLNKRADSHFKNVIKQQAVANISTTLCNFGH